MSVSQSGGWSVLKEWTHDLLDLVFPPRCLVCGRDASDNGWSCEAHELPTAGETSRCFRCARGLPPFAAAGSLCPDCRESPPPLDRLVVLTDYAAGEAIRDWILALKHGGRRDLARPLGRALGLRHRAAVPKLEPGIDVYVPVPLHPLRRFERGFDQALELARAASPVTGLECVRLIQRVRYTAPQGSFGAPTRNANLRDAIMACRGCDLTGRRVWLVDDVVTSGATLAACARELRRHGASQVNGLALALARPVSADS